MDVLAIAAGGGLTNDNWFERFRAGDEQAVENVIDIYYSGLVDFAMHRGRVRQDEAEDAGIVAIEKAWDLHSSFKSAEHLRRFLYLVVKNACIDSFRHRKTEAKVFKELLELAATGEGERDSAEDFEAIWVHFLERVKEKMGEMKPRDQAFILLHFFEEKPLPEVAELLNININTLYSVKSRVRDRLKGLLGDDWLLFVFVCLLKDLF